MNFRFLFALSCALAFAATSTAQDSCPMQTTQHVPADLTYGPDQHCGGINYSLGDVQISTIRGSCPLFVVYTPPHDIVVPSPLRTMVDTAAQLPITKVTFRCVKEWFLFLPIGSVCVADKQLNVGVVHLLLTRPCPPVAP